MKYFVNIIYRNLVNKANSTDSSETKGTDTSSQNSLIYKIAIICACCIINGILGVLIFISTKEAFFIWEIKSWKILDHVNSKEEEKKIKEREAQRRERNTHRDSDRDDDDIESFYGGSNRQESFTQLNIALSATHTRVNGRVVSLGNALRDNIKQRVQQQLLRIPSMQPLIYNLNRNPDNQISNGSSIQINPNREVQEILNKITGIHNVDEKNHQKNDKDSKDDLYYHNTFNYDENSDNDNSKYEENNEIDKRHIENKAKLKSKRTKKVKCQSHRLISEVNRSSLASYLPHRLSRDFNNSQYSPPISHFSAPCLIKNLENPSLSIGSNKSFAKDQIKNKLEKDSSIVALKKYTDTINAGIIDELRFISEPIAGIVVEEVKNIHNSDNRNSNRNIFVLKSVLVKNNDDKSDNMNSVISSTLKSIIKPKMNLKEAKSRIKGYSMNKFSFLNVK